MDNARSAINILKILMIKGEFSRKEDPILYSDYLETEVQEILETFQDELEFKLLNYDDTIYFVPNIDCELFGINPNELRRYFGTSATKKEVYLGYYIIMFIFYEFYNGKNRDPKKIDFLRISNLIEHLDNRFERLEELKEEEIQALEEDNKINISSSLGLWLSMITDTEGKRRTKYNFIKIVCKILEEHNLAYEVEDEIRTTRKLDILMRQYFLNADRVQSINEAFERGEI